MLSVFFSLGNFSYKYLDVLQVKIKKMLYEKLFNNCLYTFCLFRLVLLYNTHSEWFSTKIRL